MAPTRSLMLLAALAMLAGCDPVPTRATGWQPPTEPTFGSAPASASSDEADPEAAEDTDAEAAPTRDLSDAEAAIVDAYAFLEDEPAEDLAEAAPAAPSITASDDPATQQLSGRAAVLAADPSAFGPRVLSILPGTQPPRAVLSLADGREVVVQPGSMLPEDGLVVLAIGTEGVNLATLSPQGDRAVVSTETLPPLYTSAAPIVRPAAPPPGP